MRQKWGKLVAHTDEILQDKLDKKEIRISGVRHILGVLFSYGGKMDGDELVRKILEHSTNVSEMFESLTVEKLWDFINYYPLESIIDEYGDDAARRMMEQHIQARSHWIHVYNSNQRSS